MIILLGAAYSGLSGLWILIFLLIFINSYVFRINATTLHFFLSTTSFLKLLNCLLLSSSLFYPSAFLTLSACSTFTMYSTFQIALFLLISKGFCISKIFSIKDILFVLVEMIGCLILKKNYK